MIEIVRLAEVDDGHPLGLMVPFTAEVDGEQVATGDIMAKSWMGDETGRLINVRWVDGNIEAARLIVEAALAVAEPGTVVNTATNAEVHPDPAARIALFESLGFELWQEKEGFWWSDEGQELPAPDRLGIRTLAEVGTERFAAVFAKSASNTLDRIDADAIAAMGATAWATAFFAAYEDAAWFLAENAEGEAVGFVGVGEFEPGVGTITYIAVLPAHRGHGYVDQLLRVANRAARDLGYASMLSDTDVLNAPMQSAFRRNGHSSEVRTWHKWMHQRKV